MAESRPYATRAGGMLATDKVRGRWGLVRKSPYHLCAHASASASASAREGVSAWARECALTLLLLQAYPCMSEVNLDEALRGVLGCYLIQNRSCMTDPLQLFSQ